jgi:transcriptional regulator PpsR
MQQPLVQPLDLTPLAALAPELAVTISSVTRDIALVIDNHGLIRFLAHGPGASIAGSASWEGRPWVDTVSGTSRRKIEQLLQEAREHGLSRRREVNVGVGDELDVPVAYSAIRLGTDGTVLAVGRELREAAQLQQRFVHAQNELERDYAAQRQVQARYRTLFEVATDAVFVVDAVTLAVLDANAAAVRLYDLAPDQLVGKRATVGLERGMRSAVEDMLSAAAATGCAREMQARVVGKRVTVRVSATPFKAGGRLLLLLRAAVMGEDDAAGAAALARCTAMVEQTTDGVVVCNARGEVDFANPAFLRLAGCKLAADMQGQPLAQWLATSSGTLAQLFEQVRRHGLVSKGRGSFVNTGAPVELSAMLLPAEAVHEDAHAFGLVLRTLDPDNPAHPAVVAANLTSAIAHVGAQLGLAPLPTLMQEVARLAERHLLDSALQRSRGVRSAAARLLDLSDEDFALRLREHRLVDDDVVGR